MSACGEACTESVLHTDPTSAELRPDFMVGVVAPFGHYVIAKRVDEVRDFLNELPREEWQKVSAYVNGSDVNWTTKQDNRQWTFIDVVHDALPALHWTLRTVASRETQQRNFNTSFDASLAPELFCLITPRQVQAFGEFTSAGSSLNNDKNLADRLVASDAITIVDTIMQIDDRHPEAGLTSPRKLIDTLQQPWLPAALRGFMGGGNGFTDGIRGFNDHPVTAEFREDPKKPIVAFKSDRSFRAHPDVLEAAREHRRTTAEISGMLAMREANRGGLAGANFRSLIGNGISPDKFYSSGGCPMRRTALPSSLPRLEAAELGLTPEQLAVITHGPNPVASFRENSEQIIP